MYLIDTTQISDQKISERMPSTPSWLACTPYCPAKTSLRVYSGLVPISPYTTPTAAISNLPDDFGCACCSAVCVTLSLIHMLHDVIMLRFQVLTTAAYQPLI